MVSASSESAQPSLPATPKPQLRGTARGNWYLVSDRGPRECGACFVVGDRDAAAVNNPNPHHLVYL